MWCVLTDYVTTRLLGPKATAIRMFLQLVMIAITLLYVIWAIDIFGESRKMANIRTMSFDAVIVGGGGSGMRAALQLLSLATKQR